MTDYLPMAAVVIGRNEGERLAPSLRSVLDAGLPVIYADSGSTDGSREVARALGISVVELDPGRPFSAARGRNEGLDEAQRRWPQIEYVLFLDGDCVLDPRFPAAAAGTFEQKTDCAVATGHLAERHPDASIYNRLCAIEWRSPAGQIESTRLGGIMAARISAFRAVGGFNEQVIAGEEPDLGVRLTRAGFTMFKIDVPMAVHDAEMVSFGQWWTRSMRSGHGVAQLFERHGRTSLRVGRRELRSALFWGFVLPAITLALLWPTRGLSLLLLGGYGLLGWRVFKYYSGTGLSRADAWLMTRFILYSRFAEFAGILRYCVNRLRGRFHIIEYK